MPGADIAPGNGLGDLVDAHAGRGIQQRLESTDHIGGEQLALQVGVCVFFGVEAVQHPHVLPAHQQFLRLRAVDGVEERRLLLLINASGGSSVGVGGL